MIAALLVIACSIGVADESRYYTVQSYTPPEGEVLEVGGLVFLPDGTLAAGTRRGRVWLIDDPDAHDPTVCAFTMHAEGLWEGLGLNQIDGDVLVLQRTELSRLRDHDGDRVAEHIETIADDWGLTDNYHEFAFGLPRDDEGNLYFSLNLAFINPEWWHGQSNAPWRGWLMRLTPEGEVEPVAPGFRSPAGVGIDAEGRVIVTDNQGDWMASSPIYAVTPGAFHGHPASLRWTEGWPDVDTHPENKIPPDVRRLPPAIWIPYDWSRSTGNVAVDATRGDFGPFDDQLFVAELTNGMVLRAELEDIHGVTQGAIWPFRRNVGSVCRVAFSPEGNLVLGLTNRGWGGLAPGHGLRRIDWTGETPMEMLHCRAVPGGFDIEFTRPVEGDIDVSQVTARDYDYHWWWEYGSPEQRHRELDVHAARLSHDRKHLQVRIDGLEAGRVVRMKLEGITGKGGHELLHPEVAYTLNVKPGEGLSLPVAKSAAQPEARISETDAGWLRLTWGDPWDRFVEQSAPWRLGKAALDPVNAARYATTPGHDLLINDGPGGDDLVIPNALMPGTLSASVWLPVRGSAGVSLPGGGALVIMDRSIVQALDGGDEVQVEQAAGMLEVRDASGTVLASSDEQWMGPGQWHRLEIDLTPSGIDAIRLQDNTIVGNVSLPGEGRGDLRLLGAHAPAGFADVRLKPKHPAPVSGEPMSMAGGVVSGTVDVDVDGRSVYLSGGTGDLHLADALGPKCTIAFKTRFQPMAMGWIDLGGTRVLLGESPGGGPMTGSIEGHDEVRAGLVADRSWAHMSIELTPHVASRLVTVRIAGLPVASAIVPADSVSGPLRVGHKSETGWVALSDLSIVE